MVDTAHLIGRLGEEIGTLDVMLLLNMVLANNKFKKNKYTFLPSTSTNLVTSCSNV